MAQLAALLWTFALEAAAAAVLAKPVGATRPRAWAIAAAVVGSAATHPFVWLGNERWAKVGGGWALKIAALEVGAALLESVGYRVLAGAPWVRALALSALVNAFSFLVGLLLFALGVL